MQKVSLIENRYSKKFYKNVKNPWLSMRNNSLRFPWNCRNCYGLLKIYIFATASTKIIFAQKAIFTANNPTLTLRPITTPTQTNDFIFFLGCRLQIGKIRMICGLHHLQILLIKKSCHCIRWGVTQQNKNHTRFSSRIGKPLFFISSHLQHVWLDQIASWIL